MQLNIDEVNPYQLPITRKPIISIHAYDGGEIMAAFNDTASNYNSSLNRTFYCKYGGFGNALYNNLRVFAPISPPYSTAAVIVTSSRRHPARNPSVGS